MCAKSHKAIKFMFSAMNCRKILYTHAKYIFLFLLKSLISAKEFVTKYLMVPDDKQKCIWKVSKNTERTLYEERCLT